MKLYPNDNRLLLEQADVIDEVSDNLTYLGFFKNGCLDIEEDVDQCKILRIQTTATITTRLWADGENINFSKNWADRNNDRYTYKIRR